VSGVIGAAVLQWLHVRRPQAFQNGLCPAERQQAMEQKLLDAAKQILSLALNALDGASAESLHIKAIERDREREAERDAEFDRMNSAGDPN
jgi:hypothetical protein